MDDMKMTMENEDGFVSMADKLAAIVADEVEALGNKVEKDWLTLVKANTPVDACGDEPGKLRADGAIFPSKVGQRRVTSSSWRTQLSTRGRWNMGIVS